MIINNKYKFIFVHVPKSAGTSISCTLHELEGNNDKVSELGGDSGGFYKHLTLNEIQAAPGLLDFPFEEYFKLSEKFSFME